MIRLKTLLTEGVESYKLSNGDWNYAKIESSTNAPDIAALIKQSKGTFNDDEAVAEAAFMAMAKTNIYDKVKSSLGQDPYAFVKSFITTSTSYHKQAIDTSYKKIQALKTKTTTTTTKTTTSSSKPKTVPLLPGRYSTANDNNPFNLRLLSGDLSKQFNGTIGKKADPGNGYFTVFDTLKNGIRAGMKNLSGYFTRRNLNTIKSILSVYDVSYSPNYLNYVVNKMKSNWNSKVTATSKLPNFKGAAETNSDTIKMFRTLVKAIFVFEGGNAKYLSNIDSFPIKDL